MTPTLTLRQSQLSETSFCPMDKFRRVPSYDRGTASLPRLLSMSGYLNTSPPAQVGIGQAYGRGVSFPPFIAVARAIRASDHPVPCSHSLLLTFYRMI